MLPEGNRASPSASEGSTRMNLCLVTTPQRLRLRRSTPYAYRPRLIVSHPKIRNCKHLKSNPQFYINEARGRNSGSNVVRRSAPLARGGKMCRAKRERISRSVKKLLCALLTVERKMLCFQQKRLWTGLAHGMLLPMTDEVAQERALIGVSARGSRPTPFLILSANFPVAIPNNLTS